MEPATPTTPEEPIAPGLALKDDPTLKWFSPTGCVQWRGDQAEVLVAGTMIGTFARDEQGARNVIMAGLAEGRKVHKGHLAEAFDVTYETLRLVRRQREVEGLAAIVDRRYGKTMPSLSDRQVARIERMFEQGLKIREVEAKVGKRYGVRKTVIGNVHAAWERKRRGSVSQEAPCEAVVEGVPSLLEARLVQVEASLAETEEKPVAGEVEPVPDEHTTTEEDTSETQEDERPEASEGRPAQDEERPAQGGVEETVSTEGPVGPGPSFQGSAEEDKGADEEIVALGPQNGRFVQHVGTWLMMAVVASLGLHRRAEQLRDGSVSQETLRMALDAAIAALAIGQRCIEGVRRLATPTGSLLLRAARSPAATWVRRILGRFACKARSGWLQAHMMVGYLHDAERDGERPPAFYVDNHTRPYSGQERVRRAWRMQDKRSVPGTTDYYVHDEDGRPVMRMVSPENGPLTRFLSPIAHLLRTALGGEERLMLAFDRGGAYPDQMAELRDDGFDFVTYERKPYPLLSPGAFETRVRIDGERYELHDARTNLGGGRGRVRRISVRTPEGEQVNLLAVSEQPAKVVLSVMLGRWGCQENAMKHGVERWGINQLDGRTTEDVPADQIIPNPARRRLDRALCIAREREGRARRKLSRLAQDAPKRGEWEAELAEALQAQADLLAQRPSVPTHAPLNETDLAGELKRHEVEYKLLVDTIRTACANAESELAAELAKHLRKPAEAKKVLQNVLTAPGHVRVGPTGISVDLMPAGTRSEITAIRALFASLDARRLTLPGDPKGRRLHFKLQS